MLRRQTASNGVVYYASDLLQSAGIRHAFSTRQGGISPKPFDSLNLGNPSGCDVQDDYDRIWANYWLLLNALKCDPSPPLRVHQVHGNAVAVVEASQPFDTTIKADAIVSGDLGRTISVRIADCVPVLLATMDGKTVAAVHAGWRGVIARVVPAAIQAMLIHSAMSSPGQLIAAIGPCISQEAFEVGEEVLTQFHNAFGASAPTHERPDAKGTVDLRRAVQLQLLAAGLAPGSIDQTDRCTWTHGEDFFSHRRDRGVTGRMAAVICPGAMA